MKNNEIKEVLDQLVEHLSYGDEIEDHDKAVNAIEAALAKLKSDKEGKSELKAQVVIPRENGVIELYVLDENDSMPTNTSTNYDHHYEGSGLVYVDKSNGLFEQSETYVDDKHTWEWIEKMMRLGFKYLEQNPQFNMTKFEDELRKEHENRAPRISTFKKEA